MKLFHLQKLNISFVLLLSLTSQSINLLPQLSYSLFECIFKYGGQVIESLAQRMTINQTPKLALLFHNSFTPTLRFFIRINSI
ncbi:hypothetical protein CXB49_07480 [Chromobacterium sp. ATCC 53434]|nr:hypothetical protein CXB49_07480 [Chromobacterium sp. ATCC 53434]